MSEKKIYGKRKSVRVPLHELPTLDVGTVEALLLQIKNPGPWVKVANYLKKRRIADKIVSDAERLKELEKHNDELREALARANKNYDERGADLHRALTQRQVRIDGLSRDLKTAQATLARQSETIAELKKKNSSQPAATISVMVDEVWHRAPVTEIKPVLAPKPFPYLRNWTPKRESPKVLLWEYADQPQAHSLRGEIEEYNDNVAPGLSSWGISLRTYLYDVRAYFHTEADRQKFEKFFGYTT